MAGFIATAAKVWGATSMFKVAIFAVFAVFFTATAIGVFWRGYFAETPVEAVYSLALFAVCVSLVAMFIGLLELERRDAEGGEE